MKSASQELFAHFRQNTTTKATILRIFRLDGETFYFTDYEKGFEYNLNFYEPYAGYIPSALETKINMSVDNQTIVGILSSSSISRNDIRAGLFDYANVELAMVNYKDLTMGEMLFLGGKFGEAVLKDNEFSIELRGITQLLQQKVGEVYSVQCKATLGDSRCKVNLSDSNYTKTFIVTNVTSGSERRIFQTNLVDIDGYFNGGFVKFDATPGSSANLGAKMDIKGYLSASGQVELYEPLAYNIAINDTGSIVIGCLRDLDACKTYNNVLNYRGKPYLPGMSSVIKGPN